MLAIFALLLPAPLFDAPTLRGAQVSAYVISASNGAVLYARTPDAAMVPASTLKLVVGSAALDELGATFSFTTTLATDGATLYLRGSGDPLLEPSDFSDAAQMLATLKQTHFNALAGDDSAVALPSRYPDGWAADDLAYDYAAPPNALSIAENALHLTLHPGKPGMQPMLSVDPASPITIVNAATTGPARSRDTTALSLAWNAPDTLVLTGSVPADATGDELDASMLDPARVTLALAVDAMARGGIRFDGATRMAMTPGSARVLWTHHSPALPELLRAMWQPSDNLLAESLLDALGIERERAWLQSIGVDPATATLADGSGLSSYDRITPRDLVTILAHDWNGPNRAMVLGALPVAGESGTLEHAFLGTPLDGALIAKTGTMNHTRTLAGYLQTAHGTVIFALMIDNWMDTSPQAAASLRAFQAQFLESFASEPPSAAF
jgi:D-alanyl-D-alanine carboxypeptidase/D-alanyl-D-alanine-endopeptidase (penicillin-binding protein 4)